MYFSIALYSCMHSPLTARQTLRFKSPEPSSQKGHECYFKWLRKWVDDNVHSISHDTNMYQHCSSWLGYPDMCHSKESLSLV